MPGMLYFVTGSVNSIIYMKAHLNSYLAGAAPNSSLNVFRDLYAGELERRAGLELQKFSIDFNSLTDEQKVLFFIELDKALTNINIMRGIVADINKEVQAEAASAEYQQAQNLEKLKKEEEEKEERKAMESLGAAIEMAALKTSNAVNTTFIPGLDSMLAIDTLNKQFVQSTKVLDEQLIKVTEMLLSKVKVVEDADSKLGDTGYMDEDGNISKTGILTNVIRLQTNVDFLAQEFGIRRNQMHLLRVSGDRVVFDGMEDNFISFSVVEDLFRTSTRENATVISPIMLRSVDGIRLANEKVRTTNQYFEEKTKHLETGISQSTEWRVMILQERGVTIDMNKLDEQLSNIARNETQSFVEQVERERAAREILTRDLETTRAAREQHEKSPQVQMLTIFQQIEKGVTLRKVKPKFTEMINKNPDITPDQINEPRRGDGEEVLRRPGKNN